MDQTQSEPVKPTDRAAATVAEQTLVVIGNGMMSWKLCQKLVECGANEQLRIIVFGEEPRPAYDRVHLTELFSGKTPEALTLATEEWYRENKIELNLNDPVIEVDPDNCLVRSASGVEVLYDRLVFATGSRPFVPPIEGTALPGIFVYRTVEDLFAIMDYGRDVTRAAVIGGGLLGLEAAKAVYDLGLQVHLVEHNPILMPRQLDETAGKLLKEKIEALGVHVHCGKKTTRIEGSPEEEEIDVDNVEPDAELPEPGERTLHFADGETLVVDLVVISAGIRPRGDLAAASGLGMAPNGGIIVDDNLRTSDERIFAVGECAVHRGISYGLVLPGYEMVEILVDNLIGGTATFQGADMSAKLKLMGVSVASLGQHDEKKVPGCTVNSFCANGVYRKLISRDNRLIGAISVGEWDNLDRVRDHLGDPRGVGYFDLRRFRSTGNLWPKSESPPVYEWPPDATVCGCLRVTRGTLTQAQLEGCTTVEELSMRTGAGTMCGSCKPLLAELLGQSRDSAPPSLRDGPVSIRGPMSVREGPRSRRNTIPPEMRVESAPRSRRNTVPPEMRVDSSPRSRRSLSVYPPAAAPATPRSGDPSAAPATPRSTFDHASTGDAGPLSTRGMMLPTGRRASVRPPAKVEVALSRDEHEAAQIDAAPWSNKPAARISFQPPERISFTSGEDIAGFTDDDAPPPSIRAPATTRTPSSRMPSTSSRTGRPAIMLKPVDPDQPPSTGRHSILPPEPEERHKTDSMIPPPDSSPPASLRDFLPPSVRDAASLRIRGDSTSRLMRDAALFGGEAEDDRDSSPSGERGSRPSDFGFRASGPPSSRGSGPPSYRDSVPPGAPPRRDSMAPLRPISVAPAARASINPGRLSVASQRISRLPPERGAQTLLYASISGAVLAFVIVAFGPIPSASSMAGKFHVETFWTNDLWKQASGYTVTVLAVASLLISLRKRVKRFTYSEVPVFRAVHGVLAALTLAALILHTGLHLGRNMNRVLMIDFLALALIGTVAGGVNALSNRLSPIKARNQRLLWFRAHIILFWPLPVLLAMHILAVYYY